jgi:hypothetical protein
MIFRALFAVVVACGSREPPHDVAATPLPSASSAAPASFDHPMETSHETRPPTDRMGTMSVNGRLPPEVIQRALAPILPRARACKPKADDADMLTIRFVIDRQGNIDAVKLDNPSSVPDAVAACVSALFESLRFPAPEGGIVTVVYPLFFHTP